MCIKFSTRKGAVLPELAIAMPVALAFLLFIYWYFVTLTWRNALRDAVVQAVDLAQTRGDAVNMGFRPSSPSDNDGIGLLVGLEDYKTSGTWTATSLGEIGQHSGLLASGAANPGTSEDMGSGTAESVYNNYMQNRLGWSEDDENNLRAFHAENLYAMAYAYEIVRARIGNTLSFPCDPYGPADNSDPAAGQGCLICAPAKKSVLGTPDGSLFGIQCTMQPTDIILSPIFRILGGLGAQPIIISFTAAGNIE